MTEKTFKNLAERVMQIQSNIRDEDYTVASFKLGICYQICKNELFDDEEEFKDKYKK